MNPTKQTEIRFRTFEQTESLLESLDLSDNAAGEGAVSEWVDPYCLGPAPTYEEVFFFDREV